MYKALCVAGLLLATFALTSGSKPAGASTSGLQSPRIVSKGALLNQAAPLPMTGLFTPATTGLYRLSVYATMTTADTSSNSTYTYSLDWTDMWGDNQAPILVGNDNFQGYFNGRSQQTGVLVFQAEAGTHVNYYVSQQGLPDSSVYAIFWTVERLQ